MDSCCLSGSFPFSFTWLCSQLHTGLVTHFKGKIVEDFDREFRCIYAESKSVNKLNISSATRSTSSSYRSLQKIEPVLKCIQMNESERTSPSSSLSNSSIVSIKKSPYLKLATGNPPCEKKEMASRKNISGLMGLNDWKYQPKELSQKDEKPCVHGYSKQDLIHKSTNPAMSEMKPTPACPYGLPEDVNNSNIHRDEKRMTLGHSKLDLITNYNKSKGKHIHSRFEM